VSCVNEDGGVRAGDEIIEINGQPIHGEMTLSQTTQLFQSLPLSFKLVVSRHHPDSVHHGPDSGHLGPDSGHHGSDSGHHDSDSGHHGPDSGHHGPDSEHYGHDVYSTSPYDILSSQYETNSSQQYFPPRANNEFRTSELFNGLKQSRNDLISRNRSIDSKEFDENLGSSHVFNEDDVVTSSTRQTRAVPGGFSLLNFAVRIHEQKNIGLHVVPCLGTHREYFQVIYFIV